jgi:hypothetical protein
VKTCSQRLLSIPLPNLYRYTTDLTAVGPGGLDKVVQLTRGEVAVYSGSAAASKPPRGRGLNKPAEITLHGGAGTS